MPFSDGDEAEEVGDVRPQEPQCVVPDVGVGAGLGDDENRIPSPSIASKAFSVFPSITEQPTGPLK